MRGINKFIIQNILLILWPTCLHLSRSLFVLFNSASRNQPVLYQLYVAVG